MEKTLCELFAGVGGFRLGFNRVSSKWKTVWFSQWEPGAKNQWAHDCYVKHFGTNLDLNNEDTTCVDISLVDKKTIPNHSLIVGGFPCQDYSVAHGLATSKGIEGKKGVLWWQIYETLIAKETPFCLFENVDRLLKSPSSQRGRDFGVMLSCLYSLGYDVEWRVVNAATYGAAQRRRRIFIYAYKNTTKYCSEIASIANYDIVLKNGFFAKVFPVESINGIRETEMSTDIKMVSDSFKFDFENAGYMTNGKIFTANVKEIEETPILLGSILEDNTDTSKYEIPADKIEKWKYLKGAKKIQRTANTGFEYTFSEGPVAFPDYLDRPSRTMLTSEGTLNRSTHVVEDKITHKLRILTPVETERLQGFDDDWTNTGMPERMRYFCMGNALVVPMITRMGKLLDKIIGKE